MQLAQVLSKLMAERNNLSAYKLSKETGISDRLIGYWKNGDKLPSAENIVILATYFGISSDYLLGLVEEPKQQITTPIVQSAHPDEQKQRLNDNYDKLNDSGKKELVGLSDIISGNPKYLKEYCEDNKNVS